MSRISPRIHPCVPALSLALLTLSLVACGSGGTPKAPDAAPDYVYDGQDHSWTDDSEPPPTSLSIDPGDNSLSYESWTAATSGWGPVERDMSNGEKGAKDGHKLTLNGKQYTWGFGVHSNSSLSFNVGGKCDAFNAYIGVDDEVGNRGSVVFQVYADGQKLFDSGVMTGASATKSVNVSIAGKQELKLVVTDAGDGLSYDHADWTSAMLKNCSTADKTSNTTQYSGPLVISKGGTYSGNWESTDPNVPAVSVQTGEPVVIENSNLRGPGNMIAGSGNRLTVRNSRGYGVRPQQAGLATGNFVHLGKVISLDVENNSTEHLGLVYLNLYAGNAGAGDTVKILRNKVRNVDGRRSDGAGGYKIAGEQGQVVAHAVIFNWIERVPGVDIGWNEIVNEPGNSMVSDNINMYASSGTPGSPILIHDNYVQGGYNPDPANDKVYSGGGILVGDGKMDDPLDFGYARVFNNQVVTTTNYGIAIAGGVHQEMDNNRVLASGYLPDGRPIAAQNIGIYVWDINGQARKSPPTYGDNNVHDNLVGWMKPRSDGTVYNSATYFPSCNVNNSSCSNNTRQDVSPSMEHAEYPRWQNKLKAASVSVGAQ